MTDLTVSTLAHVQHSAVDLQDGSCWVYLGKDLHRRQQVAGVLDEKRRLVLGDRLQKVAERLRQPFLEFIANLGKMQADQIGWWSSSCSWKSMGRSDLFLLVCYQHLVDELLHELDGRRLLIVIEDPWLFRQLKDAYANSSRVQFNGTPSVWPAYVRAVVLGVCARILWTMRLLYNFLKQQWFWIWHARNSPMQAPVALYSYPQGRCLRGADGWVDPYLGDLDKMLDKAGYSTIRFSPPEVGGFERALARRARYFSPLILWMGPVSLIRSLGASWRMVWPAEPSVEGLPIRWLLLREWQLDRWRSSYPLFRIFFDSLSKFLDVRRPKLVLYPYENQPWERLLVLAARQHAVPTIGYQHEGPVSRFCLPYFHAAGEADWAPIPNLVLVSGVYSRELLAAGGVPPNRLRVVGDIRHQYLWSHGNSVLASATGKPRLLVALPLDLTLAQHLLHALKMAFPDGGCTEDVEFAVKPHPMHPVTNEMLGWPATIVAGTFEEALRDCVAVLYCGSVTGLEALVMGRTVLRYQSELLVNMDPSEFMKGGAVVDCADHDLKEKVLSLRHGDRPLPARQTVEEALDCVFSLPSQDAWLQAVGQLCPIRP